MQDRRLNHPRATSVPVNGGYRYTCTDCMKSWNTWEWWPSCVRQELEDGKGIDSK